MWEIVYMFLHQRERTTVSSKPDPEELAKAAQAASEALMKKLDDDIARVLDMETAEEFSQDHNADKREAIKQTCMY